MSSLSRAPYRFVNRQERKPREKSERLAKRVVADEILNSFLNEKGELLGCCSNECCAQLLGGLEASRLTLPTATNLEVREGFRDAVLETRKAIHGGNQVESRKRLLTRLRLGFTHGERPLRFNPDYKFPGSRSSSTQEYWWQTEEGDCIQVLLFYGLLTFTCPSSCELKKYHCFAGVLHFLVEDSRLF